MDTSVPWHGPPKRCAIYTRKSSEYGLQQDFNSLDAQKAICSAYVESQQHKGWLLNAKSYEDAAQSGATLDRPAMQDLLSDIERGFVDVVVVYKLDRLSRNLLDFVRLLDVFEKYGVTFACITQNFDTADSLGRLVMNVLLTFAQFEREMASDRVRDKKRAMAIRGLWQGGRPPFGYDLNNKRLAVNKQEAAVVRQIYHWYLQHGTYKAVERNCRTEQVITKNWVTRHGKAIRGTPIRCATIRKILTNPVYAGFVRNRDDLYEGVHQPIVDRDLWRGVNAIIAEHVRVKRRMAKSDLLDGLAYDCFGRKMQTDRQFRRGKWEVFYRSGQTEWGRSKRIKRLRAKAPEIEGLVLGAVRNLLCDREQVRAILLELGRTDIDRLSARGEVVSRRLTAITHDQLRNVLRSLIVRIEISREYIRLVLNSLELERLLQWDGAGLFRSGAVLERPRQTYLLSIPCAGLMRLERSFVLPGTQPPEIEPRKPDRSLVSLIQEARKARALVDANPGQLIPDLAKSAHRDPAFFTKLLGLNYLAPDIVAAIQLGTHRPGLTRKELTNANLPLDWGLQRQLLGFPEQPLTRTSDERY